MFNKTKGIFGNVRKGYTVHFNTNDLGSIQRSSPSKHLICTGSFTLYFLIFYITTFKFVFRFDHFRMNRFGIIRLFVFFFQYSQEFARQVTKVHAYGPSSKPINGALKPMTKHALLYGLAQRS